MLIIVYGLGTDKHLSAPEHTERKTNIEKKVGGLVCLEKAAMDR